MNRSDTLELIVEHAENQGLTSYRYMMSLAAMTDAELNQELARLEAIAVDEYFDMPHQYDAFGVNTTNSFNTP
jgi:hypothetical protein